MFTASDIVWIVGHSYIVYEPLFTGATTVLFEGKPTGTPDAGAFWRTIQNHKMTTLFTAPTALRAILKEDPDHSFFNKIGGKGGFKSLGGLSLAGERSESNLVTGHQTLIERHGSPGARVVDHWWSSESETPITGSALRPVLEKM